LQGNTLKDNEEADESNCSERILAVPTVLPTTH
jgi:hypothetical protein